MPLRYLDGGGRAARVSRLLRGVRSRLRQRADAACRRLAAATRRHRRVRRSLVVRNRPDLPAGVAARRRADQARRRPTTPALRRRRPRPRAAAAGARRPPTRRRLRRVPDAARGRTGRDHAVRTRVPRQLPSTQSPTRLPGLPHLPPSAPRRSVTTASLAPDESSTYRRLTN